MVPSGPLAGSYDAVLLLTDLEPDDAAAIKALAPRLRGVPLLALLGEGNTDGKSSLMANILDYYGLDMHAQIVQGRCSEAPYPSDALKAYAPTTNAVLRRASGSTLNLGDAVSAAEAFVEAHAAPFAIILKPPHELFKISRRALARTAGAAYGSFNYTAVCAQMRKEDATLSEEEVLARLEHLWHSFRAFMSIERSSSVGRDAVLNNSPPGPASNMEDF